MPLISLFHCSIIAVLQTTVAVQKPSFIIFYHELKADLCTHDRVIKILLKLNTAGLTYNHLKKLGLADCTTYSTNYELSLIFFSFIRLLKESIPIFFQMSSCLYAASY